jgi:hypothetical protein
VEGEACVAEWPPASAFSDAPVRRWVLRVADLPERMRPLLHGTPGVTAFVPTAPGVAVDEGYRHQIDLRASPLFDPAGLVLLRGRGDEPWLIERLPPMGAFASLSRVEVRRDGQETAAAATAGEPSPLSVRLAVVPRSGSWRNVTAAWIARAELPRLRRLAYALPHATVAGVRIALTAQGAFLLAPGGVEAIPLGTFFAEVHPKIFVLAGHEVTPAVTPEVLARAFAVPPSQVLFVGKDAHAVAIEEEAFVPLEAALLEAPPWEPAVAETIARALEEPAVELRTTAIGMIPTLGVELPREE